VLKIATPISHLFEDPRHAQHIIDNSDCLECRDRSLNVNLPGQEVFHCGIQPIHKLDKNDFYYLENIAKSKPNLKLITFHAASSCSKPYIEGQMFRMGGVQYSREELLQNARENISQIKALFGSQVSVAIENNNYYPTEAYRWITDADFIRQIVYENDIFFLFDIAHARVTAHNRELNYEDYKNVLPLDKMVQIHICHYAVDKNNIAYDEHNLPEKEEWEELKSLISSTCNVRYLTIEYYKDTNKLIKSLKEVRKIINELS
jgi:uncharacterized protein (UPF0276 family)